MGSNGELMGFDQKNNDVMGLSEALLQKCKSTPDHAAFLPALSEHQDANSTAPKYS